MRGQILRFVDTLRGREFPISVAETMDAVEAVAAAGVDRPVLREALAATLVKDEHDRATFDELFDVAFPLIPDARLARGRRGARPRSGEPGGGRGDGSEEGAGRAPRRPEPDALPEPSLRSRRSDEPRRDDGERRARAARARELLRRPFHELGPHEVEEAGDLVRDLGARLRGRLARRERRRRRGRIDVRRMLRAAVTTGGVPIRVLRRGRRPDRPDLVALVDVSGSVATASAFCLGLLAPAARYFRRVHTFAYVDHLCPVTIERGHLVPEGVLDLYARSDLGLVLGELASRQPSVTGRRTLLLVVGDARNNRRPHRADVLRRLRDRVERLVWLVPEPRARWSTGDSVLDRYAPICDDVLECETLGALLAGLRRTL